MFDDDDKIERMPVPREKCAIVAKVKFSENLNKLFSKADEIFNKNSKQKPWFDDAESLGKPDEMTIPQAQVIYKELNEGKFPEQLTFFSGGNSGINKLRVHTTNELKSKLHYICILETFTVAIQTWKRAFMIFYLRSKTKQKTS